MSSPYLSHFTHRSVLALILGVFPWLPATPTAARAGSPLITPVAEVEGEIYALALTPDGKVMVRGSFDSINSTTRTNLARLNVNGALDASFSPPPLVEVDRWLVVDNLGRTLVRAGSPHRQILRLHYDGSTDDGLRTRFNENVGMSGFALHPMGGFLAVGGFEYGVPNPSEPGAAWTGLIRLLENGQRDPDFSWPTNFTSASLIQVQYDGRVLIGATRNQVGANRMKVQRFHADGQMDDSFAAPIDLDPRVISVQRDGRVLVSSNTRLIRLTVDGSPDTTFDAVSITGGPVHALLPLLDGAILVGGSFTNVSGMPATGLAILDPTGAPRQDLALSVNPGGRVHALLSLPNGDVWVGGAFTNLGGASMHNLSRISALVAGTPPQVGLQFGVAAVHESARFAFIPVVRSGLSVGTVTVEYVVEPATASTNDFDPTVSTLVFTGDSPSLQFITVPIHAENTVPADDRSIRVRLFGVSGADLIPGHTETLLTLADNDTGLLASYYATTPSFDDSMYFYSDTSSNLQPPFADLLATQQDARINFDWRWDALEPFMPDTFAVKWQGKLVAEFSETYTLQTLSDDGILVWIDGILVISAWSHHWAQLHQGHVELEANREHDLEIHYFDSGVDATAILSWSSPSQSLEVIPRQVFRPILPSRGPPPTILRQRETIALRSSSDRLYMDVAAVGALPLSYSWYKDGALLIVTDQGMLRVTNSLPDLLGEYHVVVSNAFGSATSRVARTVVMDPPSITAEPVPVTATVGSPATLTVVAAGTEPLSYLWRHQAQPLPEGTSAALDFARVRASEAGSYDVVIGNAVGSITSRVATLTVVVPGFADPALESVVRAQLGKPDGSLDPADLLELVSLNVSAKALASLDGLQGALNLEALNLRENQVVDLAPLRYLTALRELNLAGNRVQDLSPLSLLSALETLWLDRSSLSDLTPLAELDSLRTLSLHSNQVRDLTPLTGHPNLAYLDLRYNPVTDVSPLLTLPRLSRLLLEGQSTLDLATIAKLKQLRALDLPVCNVSDLTFLTLLIHLETLDLRFNQISDLSPLSGLTRLRELRLDFNSVERPLLQGWLQSPGRFAFRVLGLPDWKYQVEATDDLRSWHRVAVGTLSAAIGPVIEQAVNQADHRMFRASHD